MTERRRPGETAQPPIRDTLPLGSAANAAVAASPSTVRAAGTPPPDRAANQGAYQTEVELGTARTMAVATPPGGLLGTAPTMAVASSAKLIGTAPTMATPPGGLLGTAPTMAVASSAGANLLGTAPTMAVVSHPGGATPIPAGGTLDLPAADQVDAANTLAPGQLLGRFVIRAQLGEGGMGVVLAGHDADLGRPVAIKLVKRELDHPAYRARLLREAQAMARLEHPNVARVYEVGSERGRLFVAMELIDGVTLAMWLRVQRRSWREIVAMFEQVGAGLAAVHRADLVHRDFKPDNVLVDRDGRARVVDFGLARVDHNAASSVSPELAVSLTRTGVMMGTPGYMAPEQQFGGSVDARADQYSFCVALREALLGGRPVDPPDAAWSGTPRPVRAAVARGLAYEPNGRYASMDELLAALHAGAGTRRTWIPIAVAASAVAVAGAVVAVIALRDPSPAPPTPVAEVKQAQELKPKPPPVVTPLPAAPSALPFDPADPAKDTREFVEAEIRRRVAAGSAATVARVETAKPAPVAPRPAPKQDVRPDEPRPGSAEAPPQPSATRTAPLPGTQAAPPTTVQRAARLPAAIVGDPAHLPLVRATIRDLGWDGFDGSVTVAKAAEQAGAELGITNVKLGMIERRRGRCDLAMRHLAEATQQLDLHEGDEAVWRGRAHTNLAICALGSGAPAMDDVNKAWLHGNRGHVQLLQALAFFEKGETQVAQGLFNACLRVSDPLVQTAIQTWLTGTGLKLP